jgi:hypothetical protein
MRVEICAIALAVGLFGISERAAAAGAVNQVSPDEFIIDHPTLINLGFEWLIQGDDNRNAKVDVSYRRRGESQWKTALPLLRVQGERIYQNQGVFDVISPNMFAGSILDLESDTEYEARFVISDPDGVLGQTSKTAVKTVTVRTRPEPKPYAGGRYFTSTRVITAVPRSNRPSTLSCVPITITAGVETP